MLRPACRIEERAVARRNTILSMEAAREGGLHFFV
jgi:hypothetical protein